MHDTFITMLSEPFLADILSQRLTAFFHAIKQLLLCCRLQTGEIIGPVGYLLDVNLSSLRRLIVRQSIFLKIWWLVVCNN